MITIAETEEIALIEALEHVLGDALEEADMPVEVADVREDEGVVQVTLAYLEEEDADEDEDDE